MKRGPTTGAAVLALLGASWLALQAGGQVAGEWVAGDFHQHTTYTDGRNSMSTVMFKSDGYGLDWWANSEHGGSRGTDGRGEFRMTPPFDLNDGHRWTDTSYYPLNPILGDGPHVNMWRWQSIRDYSFDDVLAARATYAKPILQSLEWNVPGHEHCSVGLTTGQFSAEPHADAIAQFEYLFDGSDNDVSGGLAQGWAGKNPLNNHAKAVAAVAWLQANYPQTSYTVFAHPERRGPADPAYVGSGSKGYDIRDFRDFNNAGPDVAFGFESMPGHQKDTGRGGYSSTAFGGTFGGVGIYSAKIGGLWDAMLGEGRHWWLFASSDFHDLEGDFWPGEYQKTYTYVADGEDPQAIVDGLRSGNSFVVSGDLIDGLDFRVQSSSRKATMGQTLPVALKKGTGNPVKITIRFRSPGTNHNGDPVAVDHVDLIAGEVTGKVAPGDPTYNLAENLTTRVIRTFTVADWTYDDGWYVMQCHLRVDRPTYFRLRGTNLAPNTPNQTDAEGNPLADALLGTNDAAKAWADLWFYSNPIFVSVQR